MAQSVFDIVGQFRIADLRSELENFKENTKGLTLDAKIAGDRSFVISQWQDIIKIGEEQMKKGELDPSALGLSKLVANIRTLYTNIANSTGAIISADLKALSNEALSVALKIEEADKTLSNIEKRKAQLDNASLVREAKSQTGFTGRASYGGSLKEAQQHLSDLKKLQDKGDTSSKIKKEVEFYSSLVKKFKDAGKELENLQLKQENALKSIAAYSKEQERINQQLVIEEAKTKGQQSLVNQQVSDSATKVNAIQTQALDISKKLTKQKREQNKASGEATKVNKLEGDSLAGKATKAFSLFLVFNQLKRVFNDTLRTIKQLDKAMTDASIVTSMNRKEAWALLDSYQNLARQTGVATSEIAGVVTQFLRQGRSLKDAMELTEVAAKSAKVASISAKEAVDFLTSAVNGFGLSANQAEDIADKFAAIAARSATSFQELAKAMSKVAPTAKSAGVGVDFMMGVIAKGIETTREAPENIGTAFKTIFARMREVTDLGKAMEDGMSLNRVEKALLSVGVPLRDVTGQFRNLEDVLIDVGNKWDTLTSIEQAYLATALAGSRQQPRLLAIFNDFARTKELIQISADATGQLANQHVEYMKGSEAALTNLRTAWEAFTMSFIDTQIIIDLTQAFASGLNSLANILKSSGDAAQYFTTILIILASAYTIATSKKMLFFLITKMQTIALKANVVATNEQTIAMKMNSAELKALSLFQLKNIFLTLKQIVVNKLLTLTFKGVGKEIVILIVKMGLLLLKFLPFILIAAAVVAVVSRISKAFEIAGRKADYFAGKVNDLNNEISRLSTREREVKKLVDRFEELTSKVANSADELKEMESIAEELQTIKIDNEVFNVTTRDTVTGKIKIDTDEYDRFLKFINDKREELIKANIATFQAAIVKDFEGTLNNKTLMNLFSNMGYEFGKSFIDGMSQGLSQTVITQLTEAARIASRTVKPENFMTDSFVVSKRKMDKQMKEIFYPAGEALRFASKEAAEEYIRALQRSGELTAKQARDLLLSITKTNEEIIDFEAYEQFMNNMLNIVSQTFVGLEGTIQNIVRTTTDGVERTAQIFQAQAQAYKDAVDQVLQQAQAEQWTPEKLSQTLAFIGASMKDQAILDDLILKKGISARVIAQLSIDLNMQEISDVFKKFEEIINRRSSAILQQMTGRQFTDYVKAQMQNISLIMENIFNNTAKGVNMGSQALISELQNMILLGQVTVNEANEIYKKILTMVKTVSLEGAASILKEQMSLAKEIFSLASQFSQGDFSNLMKLAESYGLDAVKGVLKKDITTIEALFLEQAKAGRAAIEEAKALIEKQRTTIGQDGTITIRAYTDLELRQLAAFDFMLEYYDELSVQEQLRNFRLGTAVSLLKEMNNILSLQENLSNLGISGDVLDILSNVAKLYEQEGIGFLVKQLEVDFAKIDDLLDENGLFSPDELITSQEIVERAMSTLNELVNAVTASYNRQKRAIEERYSAEINALKEAHSERWRAIEFTDRLAEAENKILTARRKLMGLAISGASRGSMEDAEKDLKKLQQERQKIIEDEMARKAEKELEGKMNDKLIEVQKELASVITDFTSQLAGYQTILEGLFAPIVPTITPDDGLGENNTEGVGAFLENYEDTRGILEYIPSKDLKPIDLKDEPLIGAIENLATTITQHTFGFSDSNGGGTRGITRTSTDVDTLGMGRF